MVQTFDFTVGDGETLLFAALLGLGRRDGDGVVFKIHVPEIRLEHFSFSEVQGRNALHVLPLAFCVGVMVVFGVEVVVTGFFVTVAVGLVVAVGHVTQQ